MKLHLLLAALCWTQAQGESLVALINARSEDDSDPESLSLFRDALESVNMLDGFVGNLNFQFTVFAPTNKAIQESPQFQRYMLGLDESPVPRWHHHLVHGLRQHILQDAKWEYSSIFDLQLTELQSLQDPILVRQFQQTVQGASILERDVQASNGILHVVDKVVNPLFFDQSFAQLELQSEFGPDHLQRTALTDVADFIDGRGELNTIREEGTTFLGCRIRAFNRLEEYLPQTINKTPNVTEGEFLNGTYTEETLHNFIQYNMIAKNYYSEDMPNTMSELTVPVPQCGHMWVTKRDGKLCFNNGCVVEEPEHREFLASNGVGYVLDKCLVCPGIAMLVTDASEYTAYNLKDTAQFFRASEWNLRDLRQSVGDGSDVTMFASINTGWGTFNLEDVTRLAGDKWKPHQWDMLSHMLVQGRLTLNDLQTRFNKEGAYNLTTLANETITVDFDQSTKKLTVEKGDIFFPDIEGVDGLVHFTNQLGLPRSVTHTVYDIANENPDFTTQITYIDTVRIQADMKRLLPLTALYAPNSAFENKITQIEKIASEVLENMMFEQLNWCDSLRTMATTGEQLMSLNQQYWNITVNADDFPCFHAAKLTEGAGDPGRACITKCDVLARNGIVHEMDSLLLFAAAETRPPSTEEDIFAGAFGPTATITTGANDVTPPQSAPVVFKRPTVVDVAAPSPSFSFDTVNEGEGQVSGALVSRQLGAIAAVLMILGVVMM